MDTWNEVIETGDHDDRCVQSWSLLWEFANGFIGIQKWAIAGSTVDLLHQQLSIMRQIPPLYILSESRTNLLTLKMVTAWIDPAMSW